MTFFNYNFSLNFKRWTQLKLQLFVADCDDEWAYGQHDDQYNSRHNRDGFRRDVRDVLAVVNVICYQIFFILPVVQTKLDITIALSSSSVVEK